MTLCFVILIASMIILAAGITAALAGAVALTRATEQREQAEIDEQLAEELYERSLAVLAKVLGERQMDD